MIKNKNNNKKMFKCKYREVCLYSLIVLAMMPIYKTDAQNVKVEMDKVSTLMSESKYSEAYSLLQNITEKQAEDHSDTCAVYYNYYKGSCLYYMKKYEDAIPCMKKAVLTMDKIHYHNCDYLEMLYGIGICYKELKDYAKAEDFLRKTIIKGTYIDIGCAIRENTYDELADLYVKMEKPDFADYCSLRKAQETVLQFATDEDKQIEVLLEAADVFEKQGNEKECIKTYKEILDLTKKSKGKVSDDYILYALVLSNIYNHYDKPFEASELNKEVIEIGKEFKTFKENVAFAYQNYLYFLAKQGKKDSLELILPDATNYCLSTTYNNGRENNFYEYIGFGFYDAEDFDEAVKYFEKEWKGRSANTISALTFLGDYYYNSNPEKAIVYLKKAESQINDGLQVNDETKQFIYEYLMSLNSIIQDYHESVRYAELLEPLILKKEDNAYYLRHLMTWAVDCIYAGNKDKALALTKKSEPLIEKADDKTQIGTYSNMGFVFIFLEKYDDAIKVTQKGIDLSIEKEGEKYIALTTLYHNLGRSYMLKKDYKQALSALNKSKDLQLELEGEVMQRTIDYINECLNK